jgi:hypothetical protein
MFYSTSKQTNKNQLVGIVQLLVRLGRYGRGPKIFRILIGPHLKILGQNGLVQKGSQAYHTLFLAELVSSDKGFTTVL